MATTRTIYLLRHAHAVAWDQAGDLGRRLDERGRAQAKALGRLLADAGIEYVLASPAARTRQTVAGLNLGLTVHLGAALYDGDLWAVIRGLDDAWTKVLLCGHNPDIAATVHELADPRTSDKAGLALIAGHFPTATCCQLDLDVSWHEVRAHRARLVRTLQPG